MANDTLGQWYSDAGELAVSLLWLRHWRWQFRTVSTQSGLSIEQANRQADARVDATQRQLELLSAKTKSLESRFDDIWPGLKLAYCDLGDFSCDGLPSGRCGWVALQSLTERVTGWGWLLANAQQTRTLNCAEQSEWMEREAWLSKAVDAIRARLLLEESKLLQLNFAAVVPAIEKPEKKTSGGVSRRRRRKASELTNAQEALAAAIEDWHKYEETTLSCGNCEPVSYSKLLLASGVKSKKTANEFFDSWLADGNAEYKRLCKSGDAKALALAIAKLSKTGALAMAQYSAELLADSKANRSDED